MSKKKSVLFVCLGNICRSPMAEAIFREQIKENGVADEWDVDSAGTGNYHVGGGPDPRTMKTLKRHNIMGYQHVARQINVKDFEQFDYILVMDDDNLEDVNRLANISKKGKATIRLLGSFDDDASTDQVGDPYYGRGDEGFERVYNQCWKCCQKFLG